MSTLSEPAAPTIAPGVNRFKNYWTVLFAMLVCMLGIQTGVFAFSGNAGKPPLAADPDLTKSQFTIVKNNSLANGLDENVVRVLVVDKDNNPLPGVKVTFFLPDGSTQNFLTKADGTYEFALGRTTVGSATLSVTIGTSTVKKTVTVYFKADDPTPNTETTRITILKGTSVANNTERNVIRAIVTDQWGNPIQGQAVQFTITAGIASFKDNKSGGATDPSGIFEVELFSNVAGAVVLTATMNGVPFQYGDHPATIYFVADVPEPSNPATVLIAVDPLATADYVDKAVVKARVVDANGNPVPNATIKFTLTAGSVGEFFGTTISGVTNNDGEFFGYLISKKAGDAVVTATVNDIPILNPQPSVTVKFVAGPPDVVVGSTRLYVVDDMAIADNTDRNRVRARIADVNGNPVEGAAVTFVVVSGTGNPVGSATVLTSPGGNAYLYYTSPVVGQVHVKAYVNGVEIINHSPAIITFIHDVPSTTHPDTRLYVDDDEAVANGTDETILRAHIVDKFGNPVNGAEVVFTISGGSVAGTAVFDIVTGLVKTDVNGNAIIKVTNKFAGTVSVSATIGGQPISGSPGLVRFIADQPNTGNPLTRLVVVVGEAKANDADFAVVKVIVVDANGNPVPNANVQFNTISGVASFVPANGIVTTGVNGEATINLKSAVAGEVVVGATINGNPVGNTVVVKFVADDPSTTRPETTLLPGDPEAVADNTDFATVRAKVVDANGNPVQGQLVIFAIEPGGSSTSAYTDPANGYAYTNASGIAAIKIKSTMVGTAKVVATVAGQPILNGSPQVVTFVNAPPDVTKPGTYLRVKQNYAKANGVAVNIVEAFVVDANGNPVSNVVITFKKNGASFFTTATPTLTNGHAEVQLTSTVAGEFEITATVDGKDITNGSPAVIIFVADDPEPVNPLTTLSVVIPKAVANGTAITKVKAHIVDANGNPVKNATVEFLWTGAASVEDDNNQFKTDEFGDAYIEFTSTVVGIVTVTAKVNGVAIVNPAPGGQVQVEFVVDEPATSNPSTRLIVKTTGALANGVAINEVRAHVEDAQGNPVPGVRVDFTKASGEGTFFGNAFGITDANGDVVVALVSTVVGKVDVTAVIGTKAIEYGSPAQVEFVAGNPDPGHLETKLIVVIEKAVADNKSLTSVKAHVVDAFGNPVPNVEVKFTIAGGTAAFKDGPTVITNKDGDALVTLYSDIIGTVQLTAEIVSPVAAPITHQSPATVEFVLGPPDPGNALSYIAVQADNAKADGTELNKVVVKIVDAGGHPIQGATIVFTMVSGTATIVESGPILTDANGDAHITLHSTVAGRVHLTATANGIDIINGSPAIVTFVAGEVDPTNKNTELIVVTDKASADGKATNSVKIRVADFYGNPVAGSEVVFTIVKGDATIVEAGPFLTDVNGEFTITLTSTTGGEVEIGAKADGVDVPKTAVVTFVKDPDITNPRTELIVVSNNAIADGDETNSVKAHVVDANGTPLNMKEVFFRIESGDATVLTVQPVLTDVNGDATILLASKTPGSVSVTAKVNDQPIVFGSPAKLRFVPIDIYVPRVFTPNSDGRNDIAKPIVVGLTTFHYFSIYNRWGNLLFTTKDPNMGWDGRFKGVLQPVETYLWIAEGLDKDKKKIVRRGMISLVR